MGLKIAILILAFAFTTQCFAQADLQITSCPKNPKLFYVEITGQSAANIFRALAKRVGLRPDRMQNTISNGMNCEGFKFSAEGDVIEAKCSYVMIGQKNIPYPQVDPGFSGEEVVACD